MASFVIIDLSERTGNVQVHIDGNYIFRGIIWIIGEAELKGTMNIDGTVFIQADPEGDAKVTGNSVIQFDPQAIDEAIGTFTDPTFDDEIQIQRWVEVTAI